MRKKFLKAAIATFAVTFAAGLGVTLSNVKPDETSIVSAATTTTGLSTWTASGATVSGDTATISAGGYICLPVSNDYTLTFNSTRSTTGVAIPDGTRSLLIGVNVSDPATYTSGAWIAGSSDQNSNLFIDGTQSDDYTTTSTWYAQNGQMTLTVSGGYATLTHATHGAAYTNFPVGESGYVSFYVPTGAGDATVTSVTYTDNTTTDSGSTDGTTSSEGDLINTFDSVDGYSVDTDGTTVNGAVNSVYGISDGTTSLEMTSATNWYTAYYSIGTKTLQDLKSYTTVTFTSYSTVAHKYYVGSTVVGDVPGNATTTVSIDVATYADSIFFSGQSSNYLMFTVLATADTPVYVDNLRFAGSSDSTDTGGDSGSTDTGTTSGTLIQGFETAGTVVAGSAATNGSTSTSNVTEGSYSHTVVSTATWFNVSLDLTMTPQALQDAGYVSITFDVYSTVGVNWYLHNSPVALTAGSVSTVEISVGALIENQATYFDSSTNLYKFIVQGSAAGTYYIDNLRGQTTSDMTCTVTTELGMTGAGTLTGAGTYQLGATVTVTATVNTGYIFTGWYSGYTLLTTSTSYTFTATGTALLTAKYDTTSSPSTAAVGSTQYTKFDSDLDTTQWVTSSGNTVSDGVLNFNAGIGGYFAAVNQYENFVLEFDVIDLTTDTTGGLVVAFGADDTLDYSSAKYVHFTTDSMIPQNFGSGRVWSGFGYPGTGSTVRIRVQASDGTVTAGFTTDGVSWTSGTLATDVNTAGRVYVAMLEAISFKIDNISLVNSDEYADYVVTKITVDSITTQQTANTTWSSSVDLGDLTNKTATFVGVTTGLVMDSATGEFTITVPGVNGGYTFYYNVVINDPVLDGWIYPLGTNGQYTLMCTIVVNVTGGTQEDVEGGEGDTTYVPEIEDGAETRKTILKGTEEDVSFSGVDLKGKDITKVDWYRTVTEKGTLTDISYTYDQDSKIFTLAKEYMAVLPEGETQFTIYTIKGNVSVYVAVEAYEAPTTSGETTKTVDQYSTDDVTYGVNLNGEDLLGIQVARDGIAETELKEEAYTFSDTTLTINGAYVATLPNGTVTFTVNTKGGSVVLTLIINEILAPTVDGATNTSVKAGAEEDISFTINTNGQAITAVVAVRDAEEKQLDASAYTGSITLLAAYVKELPVGTTTFRIETVGGSVAVIVVVEARKVPTVSGSPVEVEKGIEDDAWFGFNLQGETFLGFSVSRAGVDNTELTTSAYEFDGQEFCIKAAYLAELPVGTTTFSLNTTGGSATFEITVTAASVPEITTAEKTVTQYSDDNVEFSIDLKDKALLKVIVVVGSEEKELDSSAYSATTTVLTIKGLYVKELSDDIYIKIETESGVSNAAALYVTKVPAPTIVDAEESVRQGSQTAISFTVVNNGLELLGVQVSSANDKELKLDAYSFNAQSGVFTMVADYVASLTESTTFTLNFISGSVSVTITVEAVPAPTISGEAQKTIVYGTSETQVFTVDVKEEAFEIVVKRDGDEDQVLDSTAYTYASTTLTFKADYVALLPVGTTTFVVKTAGGSVSVAVVVNASAPVIDGIDSVSITANASTAVQIKVNVFGDDYTLAVNKEGETPVVVAATNYSYINGILFLTADYTDTLAEGTYTFTLTNSVGSETFTVSVVAAVVEEPSQGSNQGSGNLWDPDFDWDNWTGDVQPNFTGGSSASNGCGSSVGAVSSVALIGLAAVALVVKKKKD